MCIDTQMHQNIHISQIEVDRGGRSRNPVIVKQLSVDKLTREKSDLLSHPIGPTNVDVAFLFQNLKSAVTYFQILVYQATFIRTNVSQSPSFHNHGSLLNKNHSCFFENFMVKSHNVRIKTRN